VIISRENGRPLM